MTFNKTKSGLIVVDQMSGRTAIINIPEEKILFYQTKLSFDELKKISDFIENNKGTIESINYNGN